MKTITGTYPPLPLKYLLCRINEFEGASLSLKHTIITELIDVHPILCVDFSKGSVFRRARKIGERDYPASVQDLLWRLDGVASVGRANPEGYPVLYVADRPETAFAETHIDGSFVLLSELQILENAKCRIAPIGEMSRVQRTGRGFLTGDASSTINDMLNACSLDEAKSLLIADAFLFDCLVNDEAPYSVSSFVAKSIFEKSGDVSAVAYPSVRKNGAVNFAVKTDDFWKFWGVVGARRMYVRHLACGYYETSSTEHVIGVAEHGRLIWEEGVVDDNVSKLFISPWHP
ncbi:RES family NAD+ phosphorylase [Pseudomonas sp. B21-053]|uniref:RES family NAD+ phosphorylase n=1 Tax=Pseudomonas sp. B21-053 TaxID=2895493 RepID=UPI002232B8E8|nr:RES family NAD+ phosphorylase [Pseudomonas sp. B21-053]UZE12971.1 RES family NAD+ phosphorylase [Pseudomonas sp. B21-053]